MKVAVYLGSRPGNSPEFVRYAHETGKLLAERGVNVVYGGASVGTMGALARGIMEGNGLFTGVFPRGFKGRKEMEHAGVDVRNLASADYPGYTLIETRDFDERIRTMEDMSDGCVILPGSTGTMHELFSFYEGNVLGRYRKPIAILNLDGYYDSLLDFLHNMVDKGFTGKEDLDCLIVSSSPQELVERLVTALSVK